MRTAITLLALSAFNFSAHADNYQKTELKEFLQDFKADTKKVMEQRPPRVMKKGQRATILNATNNMDAKVYDRSGNKYCKKQENGVELCLGTPEGRAALNEYKDHPMDLVDNTDLFLDSLGAMENRDLLNSSLEVEPWSDDYWSISKGILGYRYNDGDISDTHAWDEQKQFSEDYPVLEYFKNQSWGSHLLSPSEKYDLLVGDEQFTLTKKMWAEGEYYFKRDGKVETWMGICHGWAAAAYMLDGPQNPVVVKAASKLKDPLLINMYGSDEIELVFYPSDIKSLASLLWANTRVPTKFIGGRCNTKDPEKDENGRVKDSECFDNNPASWHMTVINQIGVARRSFILDATYDYEVWNQPVYAYSMKYFNVLTGEKYNHWDEARVALEAYQDDPFKSYRQKRVFLRREGRAYTVDYIVGVEMQVDYMVETHPDDKSMQENAITTATYRYDLEVTDQGKILGGEWYSNVHPDFLWTPVKGERGKAKTRYYNRTLSRDWNDANSPMPTSWQRYAKRASALRKPAPLARVVDALIKWSRQ